MCLQGREVEAAQVPDPAVHIAHPHDPGPEPGQALRRHRAHVAEPLHDGGGSMSLDAQGVHGPVGQEGHAAARRLPAPHRTPEQHRLSRHHPGHRIPHVIGVGVHHPAHDLLVRPQVRRRDVDLGSDEGTTRRRRDYPVVGRSDRAKSPVRFRAPTRGGTTFRTIMSQHNTLRSSSTLGAKRNVLKRFERVEILKKRKLWKDGERVTGLRKTKPLE